MNSLVIETTTGHTISRQAGLVLRPIRGESDAPLIPLAVGRYVIGSGADADVRLDVPGIDARHAVLFVGPQRSVLKAFSRFTWVNDGVVRESSIKPGDRICLGPVEFEVLQGKAKRVRQPKPLKSSSRSSGVSKSSARSSVDSFSILPKQALVSGEAHEASLRRRQVIAELNGELLSQLSQIVERETVASDRERRILEQSAQLEGRRRILEERNSDFEKLRAELAEVEAGWRRKSAEISEQAIQLKLEREALERDRARLAEENARVTWQVQAAEQLRETLNVRDGRLEEQRAALELRATQLKLQEHRHSAAVAQALAASQSHAEDVQRHGAQKAAFQQQAERLRLDREQLDQERTQYESDRDKLFVERAHLAAREAEIAELHRQLHEQQADMAARENGLQGRLDEEASRHLASTQFAAQLTERQQSLTDQEAALVIERQQLDERKREIDEQHAAWTLERHTLAARANSEREAEQAAAAEVSSRLIAERAHLAVREVEIAELRRQLHEQQADMAARENELHGRLDEATTQHSASKEFAAQLAEREQALTDQEASLVIERQQLNERKREIDEQHAAWMLERHTLAARAHSESEAEQAAEISTKLVAERAHLAVREVEIEELHRQLHEQQSDLAARENELHGRLDQATTQRSASAEFAAQLAEREQALTDQEATLVIERQQLDERKREIDEQHAAWMLERHTLAARANSEEREAVQAAGAEINLLRSQLGELQTRLREERRDWERERVELMTAAEPTPAVPVEPEFAGDHEDLQAELTALRAEFESQRARFEQERNAWEAEQDLLLRDRQALETEWRRLEARAESFGRPEPVAAEADIAEVTPPPIPEQYLTHVEQPEYQADGDVWDNPAPAEEYQAQYGATDGEQETAWSEPESAESTFDQYSEYSAEEAVGELSSFESANAMEAEQTLDQADFDAPEAVAGGSDVLSLRAQLAELFGIQSRPDQDESAGEHGIADGFEVPAGEPDAAGGFSDQASYGEFEQAPVAADMEQEFDASAEQSADGFEEPEAAGGKSDEDIMSAYLARLLKKSPESEEPTTKTVGAAPEPPVIDAIEATDEAQEPEPQKPTRRLNAEEKETLRANMDSFRELANQQARAAVAKHKSNELKNGVQTVSVVAALIAVVGAILISAEFWTSQSYRIHGLACLAVSGGLGVYTVINGMRIRRLKAVAQMTEALGGDEPEPAAEKTE